MVSSVEMNNLEHAANNALSLLGQFTATLAITTTNFSTNLPEAQPDPLAVAQTSATLLKAQTTKLSLLMLNSPFSPVVIKKIVQDMSSTCMPALMSAVQICDAGSSAQILKDELRIRTRRLFKELESMMRELVAQFKASNNPPSGDTLPRSRGTLSSTGIVWEACDALIHLQKQGLSGLVVKKAQQYRDILEDAMVELKEWSEDIDEQGEDNENGDSRDFVASDEEESTDDIFNASNRLPDHRQDLKDLVVVSLKKLRLLSTLYQAIIKRRLKTFPVDSKPDTYDWVHAFKIIDNLVACLKQIPETVDELATSFYDLDGEVVKTLLGEVCQRGEAALALIEFNWDGNEDEFTAWSSKWSAALHDVGEV